MSFIKASGEEERAQAKVSIIVPVYNSAPYLPACLDSILS
ncbi:MAG: glycosyltransferase, partial [Clostridiaceae bacterium]|nr:glycosyltransferase [Clostridiaceae bacterium]